jgi:hypothetical protein
LSITMVVAGFVSAANAGAAASAIAKHIAAIVLATKARPRSGIVIIALRLFGWLLIR